jgi:BirA family biotin operon repressor/biotin-[acetyl-CoA-carboxylase] ligase
MTPRVERRTMPRKTGERTTAARDAGTARRLRKALNGWAVHAYESVSSTMEVAHEFADEGAPELTLVAARRQEHGRGRLGRAWTSPEGGVYFSALLRPKQPLSEVPQLSLVAGLSATEAVRELTGLHPSVRWPNDLLLEGRKLAGILTESRNGAVVLGIGINITTAQCDLPEGAVSLADRLPGGAAPDVRAPDFPPALIAAVCERLAYWYGLWSRKGFADIHAALRPLMALFGRPVHVTTGSDYFEGTAQDLDERGRLVVRLDSGIQRTFEVGDVSLLR